MTTPTRLSAQVIYRRVLWTGAALSWAASMIAAMVMLASGVQLDWPAIMLWTLIVIHVTVAAMIVSSMPSAEAIAARAYYAGRSDVSADELSARRV